MSAGRFREDLFYRLSVFPLAWLPLRQRPADILPLAERLLRRHAAKLHMANVQLGDSARQALLAHAWPGNVRELDNAMQRALILQQGGLIQAADLCLQGAPIAVPTRTAAVALPGVTAAVERDEPLDDARRQHEFQHIMATLKSERGRRREAAERLGISPRTLRHKLAQMRDAGLDVDAYLFG